MITIEILIIQFSGLAHFNIYNDADLVSYYQYNNETQLITLSPIVADLELPFADYIKNVDILATFVKDLQSAFSLRNGFPEITYRNYDYNNGTRKLNGGIDGNEFRVRFHPNTKTIIVKERLQFVFTHPQLSYFSKCHKDFALKNDLFS